MQELTLLHAHLCPLSLAVQNCVPVVVDLLVVLCQWRHDVGHGSVSHIQQTCQQPRLDANSCSDHAFGVQARDSWPPESCHTSLCAHDRKVNVDMSDHFPCFHQHGSQLHLSMQHVQMVIVWCSRCHIGEETFGQKHFHVGARHGLMRQMLIRSVT